MGVKVFQMLFVDDTFILYDTSKEDLEYLNWVFMWFKAILGLKINLKKNELIPIGVVPNMEDLTGILSCKVSFLPTTSLSLLLKALFRSSMV